MFSNSEGWLSELITVVVGSSAAAVGDITYTSAPGGVIAPSLSSSMHDQIAISDSLHLHRDQYFTLRIAQLTDQFLDEPCATFTLF